MFIVTYEEFNPGYDEWREGGHIFALKEDAVDFMADLYKTNSHYRYIALWDAKEIEHKVTVKTTDELEEE